MFDDLSKTYGKFAVGEDDNFVVNEEENYAEEMLKIL